MANVYLENVLDVLKAKNKLKDNVRSALEKCKFDWKEKFKALKGKIGKKMKLKGKSYWQKIDSDSNDDTSHSYRFDQKLYMQEFKAKAQENKEFVVKLIKEQKERKMRHNYQIELHKNSILEEMEEEERQKEEALKQKEREKMQQLISIQEKTKERKNYLKYMKEISEREYKKAISQTPLYKKIEESFVANFEIPELEKRKEELRKKHELFRPINYDQLKVHAKVFDKSLSEHSRSRISASQSKSPKKSQFLMRVVEEDQAQMNDERLKNALKKEMFEKKKKYSEIVKDVYSPSVDLLKQKEMVLIKAKLDNPAPFKQYKDKDKYLFMKLEKTYSQNSKKFKENPMVPKKTPKKEITVKDYIEEFRLARKRSLSSSYLRGISENELSNIDSPLQKKKLQKKVEMLEMEARKNEIKIGYLSPFNSKSLEVSDQVNSMLVDSIKAKIAILDSKL